MRGSDKGESVDQEEAFRRSLAEFTHQLAARQTPEPPDFPIAADEDDAPARRPARRWYRLALMATLATGVLAGAMAFLGKNAPPSSAKMSPPATAAALTLPAPANGPAPPNGSDFAAPAASPPPSPAPPPDQSQALAVPSPPPVEAPATTSRPPTRLDAPAIQEVQTRLQSLGLNPGPVDGVAGPRTRAAIKRYEQSKGRVATGKADSTLLDTLRGDGSR